MWIWIALLLLWSNIGFCKEPKYPFEIKVTIDKKLTPHLIRGEAVYPVAFETVWKQAVDFENYKSFVRFMVRSQILKREPDLLVRFDFKNPFPVPDFWNTLKVTIHEPLGEIHWKLADGDIRRNEGVLRIARVPKEKETDREKTKVILESQVDISALFPQFLISMVSKKEIPRTLARFGYRVTSIERKERRRLAGITSPTPLPQKKRILPNRFRPAPTAAPR
jgi:hypothetical protein